MPSLMATLGLNARPFNDALHDSSVAAKQFGKSVGQSLVETGAGLMAGFSIGSLIESTIETAEHIRQLSKEFRVSTDTIQIWEKGAHHAGMAAEDLGNAFNRLKKAREEAIGGGLTAHKFREAFGEFNIGIDELNNSALTTEQIMDRMRQAAASHPITDQEDVAGMALMGKSGAKVLSSLQEIHNLGPINLIKQEDIERLHEAEETLREVKRQAVIGTSTALRVGEAVSQFPGGLGWFSKRAGALFENVKMMVQGVQTPEEAYLNFMGKSSGSQPKGSKPKSSEVVKAATEEVSANKSLEYHKTSIVNLEGDIKKIEHDRNELAAKMLDNQIKSMGVYERQLFIKKQIADHEKKAIGFRFGDGDEDKALLEDIEVQKLKGELLGEKKHKIKNDDADPLSKFGGHLMLGAPEAAASKTEQNTARSAEYLRFIAEQARVTGLGKGQYRMWKKYGTDDDFNRASF